MANSTAYIILIVAVVLGTAVTFTTSDFGLGFFCGQRGKGEA